MTHNSRLTILLLIVFSFALFFFDLGKRDLWAPDEPTYAQVAREMWASKDFILPHLNGEIYSQKPPLLFWLIILFSLPFGDVTELSARLPSALAGIGCVIATFYLGRRFVSNRAGFLAALILSTNALFLWMSHRVAFDVALTFFVMMSLICFLKGFSVETHPFCHPERSEGSPDEILRGVYPEHEDEILRSAQNDSMRRAQNDKTIRINGGSKYFLLFYVFLALAVLTKGPAGFIPTFITVLLYLAVQKKLRLLRKMELDKGFAIFCTIVFGWVIAASIKGGHGYMNEILFKQNIGRFADPWDHSQPFYYFFINFPLDFLPWTFFIPGAFIYALSEKKKRQEILFPLLWFVAVFGFFTLSSGKRHIYILPLYPAASLIIGWFLDSFAGSPTECEVRNAECGTSIRNPQSAIFRWIGYFPGYVLYSILVALSIALPIYTSQEFPSAIVIAMIVAGGAILAIGLLYLKMPLYALFTTFLFTLLTFSLAKELVIPTINELKSSKLLCQRAKDIMQTDDTWAIYGFFEPTYLYYTGRNHISVIHDVRTLNNLLASTKRVLLVIQKKHLNRVKDELTSPVYILKEDNVGHRKVLLVSNLPQTSPSSPPPYQGGD